MAQDQDDTYGLQDPDQLLAQQNAAYEQAQLRAPNASARNINAGLQSLNGMFGGGPAVNKARQVQAQFQSIMEQVNQNSPQDEDPLTKQLRTSQAISSGMIGIAPQVALRAQEQAVRIAQAQQQQGILNLKTQEAQQTLAQETYKNKLLQNTPQTMFLAQDQGKDDNGMPLGYKAVKSYDLTDSNTPAAMRADMMAAKQNGQDLIPMNADTMAQTKLQYAQASGAARIQASMQAAMARMYATDNKQPGGGSINDRMSNRVMSAAAFGADTLSSISSMPFGTVTQDTYDKETGGLVGTLKTSMGLFGGAPGAVTPGAGMWELAGQHLRSALTTDDQKLYNTYMTGLEQSLATIDRQGLGQGGQTFAHNIRDALRIQPTDSPIAVMGKLAEARAMMDKGTEVYLASKTADPGVVEKITKDLDDMHKAVPFTRNDVIAFDRAAQKDPTMSFAQYAQKSGLSGAANQESNKAPQFQTPTIGTDMHGHPAKAVFGGGRQLENNGVGPADAASRGYGSVVDKGLYGGQ